MRHHGVMVGGMNKRGSWGSMTDRLAASQRPAEPLPSPARHCLVDGQPALLVEWRQEAAGWYGRVVSVRWLDGEGWAVVEQWLPAPRIDRG